MMPAMDAPMMAALAHAAVTLGIKTDDLSVRGIAIGILHRLGVDTSKPHSLSDLRRIDALPDRLLVERAVQTLRLAS